MEFAESKNEIIKLTAELVELDIQYKEINKINKENQNKLRLCDVRKYEVRKKIKHIEHIMETENMFDTIAHVEGIDTLTKEELVLISNDMDKTDYRNSILNSSKQNYPRWFDLERLVKEVIEFKKQYPGWILECLRLDGQYDTFPPQIFYRYTYKSPHGHSMSLGGIKFY